LLDKLAPIDKWLKNRQEKEELILRYFALSDKNNYLKFPRDTGIAKYLDNYLDSKNKEVNSLSDNERTLTLDRYYKEFTTMLEFVDNYSTHGFRKSHSPQTKRVLFEAISVGVHVALVKNPTLTFTKEKWNDMIGSQTFRTFWAGSNKLHDATKIKNRVDFISTTLLQQ